MLSPTSQTPTHQQPQVPLRAFTITPYTSTRSCQVLDPSTHAVLYTLNCPLTTSTANPYSQTLHAGYSPDYPVVAASLLSFTTTSLKVCFGDPAFKSGGAKWEKMRKHSHLSLNYNHYVFSAELGGVRGEFEWKGTHGGVGGDRYRGGSVVKKSMKLVDRETGDVVARFVRTEESIRGEKERARVEVWREFGVREGKGGGEEWDRVVLITALALQEFWRKGSI